MPVVQFATRTSTLGTLAYFLLLPRLTTVSKPSSSIWVVMRQVKVYKEFIASKMYRLGMRTLTGEFSCLPGMYLGLWTGCSWGRLLRDFHLLYVTKNRCKTSNTNSSRYKHHALFFPWLRSDKPASCPQARLRLQSLLRHLHRRHPRTQPGVCEAQWPSYGSNLNMVESYKIVAGHSFIWRPWKPREEKICVSSMLQRVKTILPSKSPLIMQSR